MGETAGVCLLYIRIYINYMYMYLGGVPVRAHPALLYTCTYSTVCSSAVAMTPTAGSSLQCEPVFDLIADNIKKVTTFTLPAVDGRYAHIHTQTHTGGGSYGKEDQGQLPFQDHWL